MVPATVGAGSALASAPRASTNITSVRLGTSERPGIELFADGEPDFVVPEPPHAASVSTANSASRSVAASAADDARDCTRAPMTVPSPSIPLAPRAGGRQGGSLPCDAPHLSGVSHGDGVLPFPDEVKRLRRSRDRGMLTTEAVQTRCLPRTTRHLGCRMVAERVPGGGPSGRNPCKSLVGARGFEPRTSSLSEKRSNRLSYAPTGALESTSAAAGGQPRSPPFSQPTGPDRQQVWHCPSTT